MKIQNRMYENIVNQVLEAIFRGDLKPDDKLPSEKELGEIFGVSRVTIREAVRSLIYIKFKWRLEDVAP